MSACIKQTAASHPNLFSLILSYFVGQYVLIIVVQCFCKNLFQFSRNNFFRSTAQRCKFFTVNITRIWSNKKRRFSKTKIYFHKKTSPQLLEHIRLQNMEVREKTIFQYFKFVRWMLTSSLKTILTWYCIYFSIIVFFCNIMIPQVSLDPLRCTFLSIGGRNLLIKNRQQARPFQTCRVS